MSDEFDDIVGTDAPTPNRLRITIEKVTVTAQNRKLKGDWEFMSIDELMKRMRMDEERAARETLTDDERDALFGDDDD